MVKFTTITFIAILFILSCSPAAETKSYSLRSEVKIIPDSSTNNKYCWLSSYNFNYNIINRVQVPEGYERVSSPPASYSDWLRHLPLKAQGSHVKLYDGSLKSRQDVHYAVLNMDTGNQDLQQCADACIRLNAEYHFSIGEFSDIHFKFTSGDNAQWTKWKDGYRPVIKGNNVSWNKSAKPDSSYKNFRSYLNTVFKYAGTQSLSQEMIAVNNADIKPGDIFIKGGFPGHAVTVVDVAINTKTKEKIFLLAQSYMPAQEVHILKNLNVPSLSPWYTMDFTENLDTSEWTFNGHCLNRFK